MKKINSFEQIWTWGSTLCVNGIGRSTSNIINYQQFVLFPVNDDSGYLLVHEDEDGAEKSRDRGCQDRPPGVASDWVYQPPSVISGGLMEKHTHRLQI